MIRSLYTAATGMDAQQLKMDVIANNLANASTTGFKKTRAEFDDLLSETIRGAGAPTPQGGTAPAPLQVGLGVRTGGTTRTFTQGDQTVTNNPTDLAIQGEGFFRVQRTNGDTGLTGSAALTGDYAYTRAGNFRLDADRRLVTQRGDIVDPGITIPQDATDLSIASDGTVSCMESGRTAPTQLGKLELYQFTNPAGLSAVGDNLFVQTAASGDPSSETPGQNGAGTLAQGQLEGSNVKAVEEMIDMISAQRAYELNSKVIQTADQMLQRLTNLR